MDIEKELKKVKEEVVDCKACPLSQERIKNKVFPVIGEGSHQAEIMFVGEAPGFNEAKTGRPFCGAAGRVLDELLESAGISRQDVYITNILKDRPPGNRDPQPKEIKACLPYLERQISLIGPKAVCTLGRYAMEVILKKFGGKKGTIGQLHGQVFETGKFKIIPLYHPAVAVYNAGMKETLKKDFMVLKKIA
jgi:uracil-DNA glycosylase